MDAVKEFKWFLVILILLGVVWLGAGGLKSTTKNDPFIQPAEPLSTGETSSGGSFLENLFPWLKQDTSSSPSTQGGGGLPISPNTQLSGQKTGTSGSGSSKTYYGADNPPGPTINTPDSLKISQVARDVPTDGTAGNEYVVIQASSKNTKPILLSGMLLESRMTGNQVDIRDGVNVYYGNTVNSKEPIYLYPGEKAYVISRRSPIGYSFQTNKCMGYLENSYRNFVIGLPGNCPHVLDYPLPSRPNAFSDTCLKFLNSVRSCTQVTTFPKTIEDACKNFVAERTNYVRCVADFGKDPDFLTGEWLIYLNHDQTIWKLKREIVDLIDQNGNLISTYTY